MSSIFDTKYGRLLVDGHIALQKGVTLEEAVADFEFVREIDLKTGLKLRTTTPQILANHTVNLGMNFKDAALKAVSFALSEYATGDIERDLEPLFIHHNDFLQQELGTPDKQSSHEQAYRFPWGGIASLKDIRNFTSYIYVSWM